MAKGTKFTAARSNHRAVWTRDKEVWEQDVQVQASWWRSVTEETTMNSLTAVGSHSMCDVCKAVERRESKYRLLGAEMMHCIHNQTQI